MFFLLTLYKNHFFFYIYLIEKFSNNIIRHKTTICYKFASTKIKKKHKILQKRKSSGICKIIVQIKTGLENKKEQKLVQFELYPKKVNLQLGAASYLLCI